MAVMNIQNDGVSVFRDHENNCLRGCIVTKVCSNDTLLAAEQKHNVLVKDVKFIFKKTKI